MKWYNWIGILIACLIIGGLFGALIWKEGEAAVYAILGSITMTALLVFGITLVFKN